MNYKNLILSFFMVAAMLLMYGCGGKYARSTPEEFGESLVKVIRDGDKAGLKELVPTKDDLLATISAADMPEDQKQEMLKEFEEEWPEMEVEIQKDIFDEFDEMLVEIKEEGKDLSKIVYKSTETGEERTREGLTMMDITAHFEYEGEDVKVRVRKAAKLNSGWVMSPDGFKIR